MDDGEVRLAIRLIIALGTGIVVAVLVLVNAWKTHGGSSSFFMSRFVTMHKLQQLDAEIVAYQGRHGVPPAALADLRERADSGVEPDGSFHGGWDEPVVYSVTGGRYSITSLGEDAAPGGTLNGCDIVFGQPLPPEAFPSLIEFYRDEKAAGMAMLSIASGILVDLAALIAIRAPDTGRGNVRSLVLNVLLVIGGSLVLAAILSTFEFPSGH